MGATDGEESRGRGRPRGGGVPVLDRERLVAALLDLVRSEGLEAVSMRRVATDTGVSVRLLYDYVKDKSQLIDLACDEITARALPRQKGGDWRRRLSLLARATRREFSHYPGLASWVLGRISAVPESSQAARVREQVMEALAEAGLSGKSREAAYLAYAAYSLGHLAISAAPGRNLEVLFNTGLDMLLDGFAAAANRP